MPARKKRGGAKKKTPTGAVTKPSPPQSPAKESPVGSPAASPKKRGRPPKVQSPVGSPAKPKPSPKKNNVRAAVVDTLRHYRLRENTGVCVYYADRKAWYLGGVVDYKPSKNQYLIEWDDRKEKDQWLTLDEKSHSIQVGSESWCLAEERGQKFLPRKRTTRTKKVIRRPRKYKGSSDEESEESISVESAHEATTSESSSEMSLESEEEIVLEPDEDGVEVEEVVTKTKRKGLAWDGEPRDVYVWYADKKRWFLGTVKEEKKGAWRGRYLVEWADKKEGTEWISLAEKNHTTDDSNPDRWCWDDELDEDQKPPVTSAKKTPVKKTPVKTKKGAKKGASKETVTDSPASTPPESPVKRSPGRPRKNPQPVEISTEEVSAPETPTKETPTEEAPSTPIKTPVKKSPGRPKGSGKKKGRK